MSVSIAQASKSEAITLKGSAEIIGNFLSKFFYFIFKKNRILSSF